MKDRIYWKSKIYHYSRNTRNLFILQNRCVFQFIKTQLQMKRFFNVFAQHQNIQYEI